MHFVPLSKQLSVGFILLFIVGLLGHCETIDQKLAQIEQLSFQDTSKGSLALNSLNFEDIPFQLQSTWLYLTYYVNKEETDKNTIEDVALDVQNQLLETPAQAQLWAQIIRAQQYEYHELIKTLQSMESSFLNQQDKVLTATYYEVLHYAYFNIGAYDFALDTALQAQNIWQDINWPFQENQMLNRISFMQYIMGAPKKSEAGFRESLTKAQQLNSTNTIIDIFYSQARIAFVNYNPDRANSLLKQLEKEVSIDNTHNKYNAVTLLKAEIAIEIGDVSEAEYLLYELEKNAHTTSKRQALFAKNLLANLLLFEKKLSLAESQFLDILSHTEAQEDLNLQLEAKHGLFEIYYQQNLIHKLYDISEDLFNIYNSPLPQDQTIDRSERSDQILTSETNRLLAEDLQQTNVQQQSELSEAVRKMTNRNKLILYLTSIIICFIVALIFLYRASVKNYKLANKDALTNINNRRSGLRKANKLLEISFNEKSSFHFAILDLDHFKQINDNFGHAVGDEVIVRTARILKEFESRNIVVARFGGEEFICVMANIDTTECLTTLNIIRERLEKENFEAYKITKPVTTSIGVCLAESCHENELDHLIAKADHCLYQAKAKGRNCVEFDRL